MCRGDGRGVDEDEARTARSGCQASTALGQRVSLTLRYSGRAPCFLAADSRSRTFSRSTTSLLGPPLFVGSGSGDAADGRVSFNCHLEHAGRRPLYPMCKHGSPHMRGPTSVCGKFSKKHGNNGRSIAHEERVHSGPRKSSMHDNSVVIKWLGSPTLAVASLHATAELDTCQNAWAT
jgi:hypothetical protein